MEGKKKKKTKGQLKKVRVCAAAVAGLDSVWYGFGLVWFGWAWFDFGLILGWYGFVCYGFGLGFGSSFFVKGTG